MHLFRSMAWELLVVAVFVSTPALAAETQTGHIAVVNDGGIIVRTPVYEYETIKFAPNCRITRAGRVISWSDLRAGDAVLMSLERRDGDWLASAIDAHSPF